MSVVQGSSNINQVNRLVAEVFGVSLKSRDNKWQQVFTQKNPTRKDEKVTTIKLDNAVSETADGGAYTPSNVLEIGSYTVTQKIFKDSITLGDFAEVFDNYGAIQKAAMIKGRHYAYQQDSLAADFLNNATSTTAPYGFEVDGAGTTTPLIGTTQPVGDTGLTQINTVTGGLSEPNFITAWERLVDQQWHDGNILGYQARRFVVPTEQNMAAWKLLYSPESPETADRSKNPLNSLGIELIHWDLLTNPNNCFLMTDRMFMPHFAYYIKKAPNMRVIRSDITGNVEYQFNMMLMAAVSDYQGLVAITA